MISWIIGGMIVFAVISGAFAGRMGEVSSAAMTGCSEGVELALSLAGTLCL